MTNSHPEGLDESALVGDGGRSWFKNQQKIQHENNNNSNKNKPPSNIQNEQTKLLTKQQKKRFKRQKKKQRKQKYNEKSSTDNTNNSLNSAQNRSSFLYGNKNKNKPQNKPHNSPQHKPVSDNRENNNPYTNKHEHKPKPLGFKSYVKSSNQEELNSISAKMLRAKLVGNTDLYNELESKLNKLREESFIIEHKYLSKKRPKNHNKHKDNNNNINIDKKGKQIELIIDGNISKQLHELDQETNVSDNNKRKRKRDIEKEQKQKSFKRRKLISEHKNQMNWLNSCEYCIENEEIFNNNISYLVIYYGNYMYLAIPKQECLLPYECIIVPNMHLKSYREGILNNNSIGASKNEQLQFEKELYYIQKIICKMFKTKCDKGVIFIETVRNLKKNYHSIIHCYPIEIEKYNLCPIYFKKSIIESDVLWNTNKKLIEITKDKPLNKSIPHYMSYFYVQFGLFDGYAHIIEDENKIKQDFGAQIIAGIIEKVLFKIKNECYQKQIQQVDEFKILFEPFKQKLDEKLKKIQKDNVKDTGKKDDKLEM